MIRYARETSLRIVVNLRSTTGQYPSDSDVP